VGFQYTFNQKQHLAHLMYQCQMFFKFRLTQGPALSLVGGFDPWSYAALAREKLVIGFQETGKTVIILRHSKTLPRIGKGAQLQSLGREIVHGTRNARVPGIVIVDSCKVRTSVWFELNTCLRKQYLLQVLAWLGNRFYRGPKQREHCSDR
jgi:hypothetical protein